jgi:sulfur carrier protein ThiS
MMKIKVKLFGTLGQKFPGYDYKKGLEMELPEGTSVGDLLARLGLRDEDKPIIAVGGLIWDAEDELPEGAVVSVLQAVYGG